MEHETCLTGITKAELKDLIKEAMKEILREDRQSHSQDREPMDIHQAAAHVKSKVSTIYEKTSKKKIPHFKKGNRIFFYREQLDAWIREGKVKTIDDVRAQAITYTAKRQRQE